MFNEFGLASREYAPDMTRTNQADWDRIREEDFNQDVDAPRAARAARVDARTAPVGKVHVKNPGKDDADSPSDDGKRCAMARPDAETAVAADSDNEAAAGSDNETAAGSDDGTAVAAVCEGPLKHDVATNKMEEDIAPLNATQADSVTQSQLQIAALQSSMDACRDNGLLSCSIAGARDK